MTVYAVPELGEEEAAALRTIDRLRKQLRFSTAEPRRWVGSVRRVLAARAIQGAPRKLIEISRLFDRDGA